MKVLRRSQLSLSYVFVLKYIFGSFAVFSLAFIFIKFSELSAQGVKKGIDMCLKSIIPSLYPFMILTNIYASSDLVNVKVPLFNRLIGKVFRIPENSAGIILFSFIGGLPVGAKMTAELYKRRLISQEQGARIMCFCVNPGPAFLISFIGADLLGSRKTGILIYISLILSSVSVGVLSRFFATGHTDGFCTEMKNINNVIKTDKRTLENAVINSSKTLFVICSWIVIFSCISELILCSDIQIGIKKFLLCTLEMTNGSIVAAEHFSAPIVAAVIGFSGICGHFQLLDCVKSVKLEYKYFLVSRIVSAGLSVVYCSLLTELFPIVNETFAMGTRPVIKESSGSVLLSVMMIIMALLFIVGDNFRFSKKKL